MTDKREHAPNLNGDVVPPTSPEALRQQAEARLLKKTARLLEHVESQSPEQVRQTLYELQVHQIELEMQNEELRDAHVALDFERARYFELYDLAPIGYCTLSEQGLIMQANLTVASLLGTTRSELLKQRWTRFIHKDDADLYYLQRKKLLESGEPQSCELRMTKKDGTPFWGQWAATVSHDSNGELELRAVLSDITERKQAEASLQLSNDRFELAVKASQAVLWQQDLELRYRWIRNPVPGFDGSQLVGKRDVDVMESLQEAALTEALKRDVIVSGVGKRHEILVHIQNEARYFDMLMEPMRDADGLISGVTCAAIEITERKHAEAAQRQSEQNYRALSEASLDIAYRMSADWSMMLPLDGRDVVASSDRPLADWAWLDQNLPSDEHTRVRQMISEAIACKKLFEMEHRVLRPDGSTAWVRSRAVPLLDENEGLVEWFGAASDITERKRIEQELIKTTAVADNANRAKSEFLSSMSHELRTPLNAILGFAQLIETGSPPPTATQKCNVDYILKAGWYLLALVDEILDLAVIESGAFSLSMEAVSLDDVVRECQAMLEQQAQTRGISLSFPRFDAPCHINADFKRVKQVLSNLLSNAIKYNRPNGSVVVDWVVSEPGRIRISIADTGDGLSADSVDQLFQPFNRLGKESGSEQGTGIGLVVSKRIVEMMGGEIGVQSAVGKGSVFWFELNIAANPSPVADVTQTAAVALMPEHIDMPLRTLLYVEDNPANLALVEAIILRRPDLRLLTATNGDKGIEIARAVLPDVILMDINLPGISGIEAMKILAQDPATARIPVLALSANAIVSDIEYSLGAGFFRYLTKPIKINEFMATLDSALEFSLSTASGTIKKENP